MLRLFCCLAVLHGTGFELVAAAEPELLSVKKVWDAGPHNAFTDLIRWHDHWYCTFRESDDHVGGDGKVRLLTSSDGEAWESSALIREEGIDLRDPKLSITPDDRLMIVAGGSVYEGKTLKGRQPRVMFSKDGREWTTPQRVLSEGEWLWRVTWHGGRCYGVSYDASTRTTPAAKAAAATGNVDPGPADWKLKLVASDDGVKYTVVAHLDVPGHPNETTLRFLPDGELVAMVRREGGNTFGWIGRSHAPYTDWTWKETAHRFGGPNFIRLPDGALWASSRSYPGGAKTVLARMTAAGDYDPALTFPSGGDTSYAGMVWHEGKLWMSYYSSHEGKTSIYVAQVRVPLMAENLGSRKEPLVDAHLIDEFRGSAKLTLQRPSAKEVVLTANEPWEGNTSAYYTVLQDGDRFRMYYRGSHFDEGSKKPTHREVTCYAESRDGVQWTKPKLGLYDFDGSKDNNIVWNGPGTHCFTPFLDTNPHCAADARYKALTAVKGGLLALKSADGIHWEKLAEQPVITKGAFDSQNLAFWDSHLGKYREYHRAFRVVRDIMTGTSDDFLSWTEPQWLDYPNATPEHLYTNTVQPYPGAPHILVGFPTRFLPETEQTEPTLMVSRDGLTFLRYPEPVIQPTDPEDRDGNRSNYMAWGLVQLPGSHEWSVYAKEAYYTGPGSRLRRFTYRPDGLVALTADSSGGEIVTRPVRFTGTKLVLNARTSRSGDVRIELQDADGKPLPGYRLEESRPVKGDELATEVSWESARPNPLPVNQPVRLRIVLRDAMVYSMQFADN